MITIVSQPYTERHSSHEKVLPRRAALCMIMRTNCLPYRSIMRIRVDVVSDLPHLTPKDVMDSRHPASRNRWRIGPPPSSQMQRWRRGSFGSETAAACFQIFLTPTQRTIEKRWRSRNGWMTSQYVDSDELVGSGSRSTSETEISSRSRMEGSSSTTVSTWVATQPSKTSDIFGRFDMTLQQTENGSGGVGKGRFGPESPNWRSAFEGLLSYIYNRLT